MFEISYQCFPYHRGYLRIGTFFDLALGRLCDERFRIKVLSPGKRSRAILAAPVLTL